VRHGFRVDQRCHRLAFGGREFAILLTVAATTAVASATASTAAALAFTAGFARLAACGGRFAFGKGGLFAFRAFHGNGRVLAARSAVAIASATAVAATAFAGFAGLTRGTGFTRLTRRAGGADDLVVVRQGLAGFVFVFLTVVGLGGGAVEIDRYAARIALAATSATAATAATTA
jgi:hypothetical protein